MNGLYSLLTEAGADENVVDIVSPSFSASFFRESNLKLFRSKMDFFVRSTVVGTFK